MQISCRRRDYPWMEGIIEGCHFDAEVYDAPSEYGINEGRISKLMVWKEVEEKGSRKVSRKLLANYDRGWDIKPQAQYKKMFDELVSYLESQPPCLSL